MHNLEQVNAKCYDIFNFRYNDCLFHCYVSDLYDRELERIKALE